MSLTDPSVLLSNPFSQIYERGTDVILFAHSLIGTVRGKSANGLMIHGNMFNVVAIVDKFATGKDTSQICQGVSKKIPVYEDVITALHHHQAKALVLLIEPDNRWFNDFKAAAICGIDLINTSFRFIKNIPLVMDLVVKHKIRFFDLRDVAHLQAYPDINILKRKCKVVFVTGTDCGLGKRTAAFEMAKRARQSGINAVMYATGQTGLMLGEKGTVVDSLVIEFSNGVVSQHICQLDRAGYELVFVEGQSDIFHPANSAMSLALLHGSNPDCIVLVHDENRKFHKGFDENAELYRMHPVTRYIQALEMLSLPCGPFYKTVGIATIGAENIETLSAMPGLNGMPVADVLTEDGAENLLASVVDYCRITTKDTQSETLTYQTEYNQANNMHRQCS